MVDVVSLAIPFFFLGMGVEWVVGRVRKQRVFRGPDVVADLSLGTMQTLAGIVGVAALVGGYEYLYENWRVTTISDASIVAWVILFLAQDMLYYWFHRISHVVNIGWATHAPHHSSEDFNLAVALRQGPLQPFLSHIFYLPLAIVGFPLEMFAFAGGVNTVYQFFIHTELVGKLGPLEWFMNTPSHHRVHHGVNGRYLDRNHGGMLIIWDRMFGTFEPEGDRPIYGTVKQVTTWNPLAAAIAPFADIVRASAAQVRLVDKLKVWVMPPGWSAVPGPVIDVVGREKFNHKPTRAAGIYVTAMFIVTLVVVVLYLFVGAAAMTTSGQWVATAWITISFANLGALLDGRAWAKPVEVVRLLALVPLFLAFAPH